MTRKIIIIILSSITFYASKGQEIAKNNLIIELGGAGLAGSFNYEFCLIKKEKLTIGPRFGVGYFPMIVDSKVALGTLNPLVGAFGLYKFSSHHIETGISSTVAFSIDNITSNNRYNDCSFFLFPSAGYRYQKPGKGKMIFRLGYSPAIFFDGVSTKYKPIHFRQHFYIGMGYSF